MGWVTLPRYAAVIPAADVFQLPFLFNTEAIATAARAPQSEIRQLIEDAILVQSKSRVLWWVPQGPLVFLSHGVSVADPRNLAGKIVRTFGPAMAAVVRECGGEPKDIGGQAQERAYESHIVDMGMTGITIVMERKLWRFMNVVTRTNHAILESLVVMNEAFWQHLSEDHAKIVAAASRAANEEAADLLLKVETAAYAELADRGVQIVDLSRDELIAWRVCSSDVISNFVEKSDDLRQKLMTAYGRLRQQPCCNQAAGNIAPNIKGERGSAAHRATHRRRALQDILGQRTDVLSPRMIRILESLVQDWRYLDDSIDCVTGAIESVSKSAEPCRLLAIYLSNGILNL
jgi:C4-dicarboxylate-binding protein DctP